VRPTIITSGQVEANASTTKDRPNTAPQVLGGTQAYEESVLKMDGFPCPLKVKSKRPSGANAEQGQRELTRGVT
jgi:hypothetical protein